MKTLFKKSINHSKLLIINSLVSLFFSFGDPSVLTAQNLPTGNCQTIYDKAVAYDRAGDYEKAILKYNAVKACDPNFKAKTDSIILTVFKKMNALRKQAESDKKKAVDAQNKEAQARKRFEEQVITTQRALEEARIQKKRADSLRNIAELGQRKADNLSKYYKRKAEQADRVLLTRIIEYMYLKHTDDDIAERIYAESLADTTLQEWSQSQVLDLDLMASITSIAVSADGQFFFTGDAYGVGTLWDIDGNQLHTFIEHYNAIIDACFSPDNKTILTISQDKTVNLWHLNGELIRTLFTSEDDIQCAAFSPDAQKILTTGYYQNTATLRDTVGNVLTTFDGHQAQITALAFAANGQYVLTGSNDSTARLYTITGELVHVFENAEGGISSVAISPNGEYIATNNNNTSVWLWNKTGRGIIRFKHDSKVTKMCFSDDNATLLTGSVDGSVRLHQWSDSTKRIFKGHTQFVADLAFVPHSPYALSSAYDGSLRLWDLSTDQIFKDTIQLQDKREIEIYFPPNDTTFAVLSRRGDLKLYTLYNQLLHTYKEDTVAIIKATFSPDGKTILAATSDRKMKLLDLKGRVLQVFQADSVLKDSITALAFSFDGQFILSQTQSKNKRYGEEILLMKLWNVKGELLKTIDNVAGLVVGFSPYGQSLLTYTSYSSFLFEWFLDKDKQNDRIDYSRYQASSSINRVFLSTKNRKVLLGNRDTKVQFFDDLGSLKHTFPVHKAAIDVLSLSADGQFVAVATADSLVRIWDTAGHLLKVLPRQKSPITALTFLPDNQKIWVCTEGGNIAIYRIKPIQVCSYLQLHHLGINLEPDDYVAISDALFAEEMNKKARLKRSLDRDEKRNKVYQERQKKEQEEEEKRLKEAKKRIKDITQTRKATLLETRDFLEKVLNFITNEPDSEYMNSEKILFDMYIAQQDSLKYRAALANHYNSLAWQQLLRKEYAAAETSLQRGIAIDSSTIILYTNLAPALLFQGKFEAAKAEYLRWKDKPFNLQDLSTYRDAFWADFRSFEEAECIPPERLADVAAIKKLLSQ